MMNIPVFETILKAHHWDFCQLQLNYMDMNIQAGQKGVDLANQLGVPLVVMDTNQRWEFSNPSSRCNKDVSRL